MTGAQLVWVGWAALCAFSACLLMAYAWGRRAERRYIARATAARRGLKMSADGSTIVDPNMVWIYTKPPRMDSKVLLLTIGDIQTSGSWYGEVGQHFKAWHPEPKRDKALEHKLGILESTRVHQRPRTIYREHA